MKRPHSAKPARQFWAQPVSDDHSTEQQPRQQSKVQRKQLHGVATSHDLSRLLPKKIQHDKERLYCEAIQLKTALNEMSEDNLRLRTRVAVLEKQKEKLIRIQDAAPRRGIPAARYDKENGIVAGLKKMIRQAKEQSELSKAELSKLKKTIRYIKLNELQIQKQTVIEQNRNLSRHIQTLLMELEKRERQEETVKQLESELKATTTELRSVTADNIRYEEILEDAELKNKELSEQLANIDKKWQRDLTLEKRKVQQLQKNLQNMRLQINNLHQKLEQEKKKPQPQPKAQKKQTRPVSSNPYKPSQSIRSIENQKKEALLVNQKLKRQLQEAKKKLAQSEDKLKVQPNHSTSFNKDESIDFVLTKNELNQFMDQDYKIKQEEAEYAQQFQQSNKIKIPLQKGDEKQSKLMKQIRQMLTYRMKYNRYPFEELKADIEVSPLHSFTYQDLFNMLIGQPFFLTKQYATEFLKICYGRTKIDKNAELNSDVLVHHLRSVIDDFQLLDEQEQEKMLYRLAEIMTRNRSKLEKQFAKVCKDGDFVTKDQIRSILHGYKEISSSQVELALCYIAVSSENLSKINYFELLDKFFINNSRSLGEQSNFSSKHKGDRVDEQELSMGEHEDLDNGEPISGEEDII